MANFSGDLGERVSAPGLEGEFRIDRHGNRISSWQRSRSEWTLLGEHTERESADMYVGSKIWSMRQCGRLETLLSHLQIEAEIPEEQPPPIPAWPDPLG